MNSPEVEAPSKSHQYPKVGVGAVIVRDGAIVLVQRGKEPSMGLWSLPGGLVEMAETLMEATVREVREECGLDVTVTGFAGVVERIFPDEGFHFVIVDYFAEAGPGLVNELTPGDDVTAARWVPLTELDQLPIVPRLVEALKGFGVL